MFSSDEIQLNFNYLSAPQAKSSLMWAVKKMYNWVNIGSYFEEKNLGLAIEKLGSI